MGSMPRRARHLIPAGLPHRRRVMAGCAVLIVLAHLLLAQLTLGLALVVHRDRPGQPVAAVVADRARRRRDWSGRWRSGPGARAPDSPPGPRTSSATSAGGAWSAGSGRPSGPFAGAGSWLPRQLPIALIAGAAEAALIGWLELAADRRVGGSAAASRPGRGGRGPLWPAALIRSGSVVTRDGCALGVARATGAVVELRWPEIAGGVLVAGADDQEVTVTSLQVVHAALRRRKPLIVIDVSADAAIARALTAACRGDRHAVAA